MGDMALQVFSDRLKILRLNLNVTQKDFAEKIGITASALSSYENNLKNPSIAVAKKIAETFNVSIDWLCGLTNEMNKENDIKTYSDLIRLFLKIQKLEMAPNGFTFMATNKGNGIITENGEMYSIIRDIQKMQNVLSDGTLSQDIYNTWLDGFLEKHNVPLPTWETITQKTPETPLQGNPLMSILKPDEPPQE